MLLVSKPPKVTVHRVTLKHMEQSGEKIDFVRDSTFSKTFSQLRGVDPFALRPLRPHGAEPFMAFEVVIKGEHVVGEGGPYRQFFTDVGRELQDPIFNCPLLTPCPNRESKTGDNRDKFLVSAPEMLPGLSGCPSLALILQIRPSASSALNIQMFEFLGLLFGCCIRTGKVARFRQLGSDHGLAVVRRALPAGLAAVHLEAARLRLADPR